MEIPTNALMIILYILFIFTFLLGYYLGTKRNVIHDLSTGLSNAKLMAQKVDIFGKPIEELKVGAIRRPSNEQIKSSQIPDKQKEGLKAMEETLKDIPELNV